MREQTQRNIQYLAGLSLLQKLAALLGWDERQLEAARAVLERQIAPTLARQY